MLSLIDLLIGTGMFTLWTGRLSGIESLRNFALMEGIKESSTLRVGPKREKPAPRIVYRWGKQDGQVRPYLRERRKIKRIISNLRVCPLLNFCL